MNELVQKFKIYLEESGKSMKTIESYVGDTSAFVTFIESKGVDFQGEMKRFYITNYRNYVIGKQVERILFYIQNDEKVSRRNRRIILLLLYTDLRVSEI